MYSGTFIEYLVFIMNMIWYILILRNKHKIWFVFQTEDFELVDINMYEHVLNVDIIIFSYPNELIKIT